MCTFIETTQQQQQQQQQKRFLPTMPYKDDLPISQSAGNLSVGIRKRMFSFSVSDIIQQPLASSASSASWAFRKSRSMPSLGGLAGGPLRRWWESSWGWLLSKQPPASSKDVEMNDEEEVAFLGCGSSRGSLSHVFYKVRSEILKLVRTQTLPTTHKFRYDSFSYAQNFDDGSSSGRVAE